MHVMEKLQFHYSVAYSVPVGCKNWVNNRQLEKNYRLICRIKEWNNRGDVSSIIYQGLSKTSLQGRASQSGYYHQHFKILNPQERICWLSQLDKAKINCVCSQMSIKAHKLCHQDHQTSTKSKSR